MTNDCKTCPVSTGTHKPAEAVHQQIAEPQPEALRLADALTVPECTLEYGDCMKAGELLRAQHALLIELADQLSGSKDRIAELEAQLAAAQQGVQTSHEATSIKPTFMTNDQAISWAWTDVRKDVGTENWTTGDSSNFYGFFLHGWNYRGQYELQRNAAKTAFMREISETCDCDLKASEHPTQQGMDASTLLRVIQRLNQNPYSLTKSECISEVQAMREEALAAQAKQAEALQAARNGGCGCCSNACDDRADGCRFVHENLSDADMVAAQAKQGGA